MQDFVVDSQVSQVGLLRDLSLQFRVAVDSLVHKDSGARGSGALGCHIFLQFVDIPHFELILRGEVLLGHYCHPDFIQVVHFWHEKDSFFLYEVNEAVAVHLDAAEHIVEEGLLVLRIRNIRAVERNLGRSFEKCHSLVLVADGNLVLEEAVKPGTILLEGRVG